ncbi:hypothetical protein DB31_1661 [Hyalangium minutum]|uniref:Protein kinase domain-containing protein n=1 Tax=Hyalangium minutum TaxID=394096 RepID=A0A085WAD0_9BACT|nr:hypothetical protein DB31_1661 [Hyalangium minutum]
MNGFRLVRYLDQGGYGCVWVAENIHCPGQYCALKFCLHSPEEDPTADARALREVQLLLQAAHPNVRGVLGHGRWPNAKTGIVYIILEWVEGATLLEWARQANPSFRQVVHLAQKLARALQEAHERQVMHRDVKPDNVLVRAVDGEPFLSDFGMGQTERSTPLTWGGAPPGTRSYLSPEALAFSPRWGKRTYRFRPADDWYALGVTLYQLLTEVLPFPDEGMGRESVRGMALRQPVPPHLLNPRVPLPLSRVVMRMLSSRLQGRYRDGRALCEALERGLSGAGVWDTPVYEPHPPQQQGQTPTQEPTPGDGPPAQDEEVAWNHAVKPQHALEEQRRAVVLSRRDALLPRQARAWGRVARWSRRTLALVAVAMMAWVAWRSAGALFPGAGSTPEQAPRSALAAREAPFLSPADEPAPEFVAVFPSQPSLTPVTARAEKTLKDDSPMETPKSSLPSPPAATSPRPRGAGGARKAALCAAGVIATGCSGIPLRPSAQECPPAAIQNMRARRIGVKRGMQIKLDVTGPEGEVQLKAGQKVVSESRDNTGFIGPGGVPEDGTLLYGKVVAGGEGLFFVRYEEALFPGESEKVPICAHAADAGTNWYALTAEPGSTNEIFTTLNNSTAIFLLQFPGEP